MTDINWIDLVGERVLVYMSPWAFNISDRVVTGYRDDGFINFDHEGNWYHKSTLRLYEVHRSNKYKYGYTWD